MADTDSRVTIHMVASLDGFIARKDGSVDWMEPQTNLQALTRAAWSRFVTKCEDWRLRRSAVDDWQQREFGNEECRIVNGAAGGAGDIDGPSREAEMSRSE